MKTTAIPLAATLFFMITFSSINAQPLLRTEHAKMCYFNNGAWADWPDDWTDLTARFRFTQVDAFALVFRVELTLAGFSVNSRFTYEGYDSDNNWFKYKEVNGTDVICIEGVRMSYLANNGWPSYTVRIYIWSKSNSIALVFE